MRAVIDDEFICSLPSTLPRMARIAEDRRVSIACERFKADASLRRKLGLPPSEVVYKLALARSNQIVRGCVLEDVSHED